MSEHMSIHMSCPLNLYIDVVDISLSLQEMRNDKPHFSCFEESFFVLGVS